MINNNRRHPLSPQILAAEQKARGLPGRSVPAPRRRWEGRTLLPTGLRCLVLPRFKSFGIRTLPHSPSVAAHSTNSALLTQIFAQAQRGARIAFWDCSFTRASQLRERGEGRRRGLQGPASFQTGWLCEWGTTGESGAVNRGF